ncbi:MAG: hypothetical protein ABW095_18575 [Candidatus Thiodiazotropha sp.]
MSHGTRNLIAAIAITFGTTGTASAVAFSSSDFSLSLTLSSVQLATSGSTAERDLDYWLDVSGGSFFDYQQLWGVGTGSTSGSGSLVSDGVSADPTYGDFPFTVGSTMVMSMNSSTTASGAGSEYYGQAYGFSELYVDNMTTDEIQFTFDYSWTRDVTLSNTENGEHTSAFLDAFAEINNVDLGSDQIVDTNGEHFIDGNTAPLAGC